MAQFTRTLRAIFVGPRGVHWVWKILCFIAIVCGLALVARLIRGPIKLPNPMQPGFFLHSEAVALAIILASTGLMARIEGRSFRAYGLAERWIAQKLMAGWLAGLASLSILAGVLTMAGQMEIAVPPVHDPRIIGLGCLWLVLFLIQAMVEETLFRGYVQATLARGIGFWPASFAISLLFALGHLGHSGQTLVLASTAGVAGLMFCLLLKASGSLWLGIGFHAAWNWAESFLYGTGDSGLFIRDHFMTTKALGSVWLSGGKGGPEGSLLAGPALILGTMGLLAGYRAAWPWSTPR